MNLATITALIDSKIRNKTPKVVKVEHADVEQAIVNEIYSPIIWEVKDIDGVADVGNVLVRNTATGEVSNTNIGHNITLKKIGNVVFANILFINNLSTFYSSYINLLITDADYEAKSPIECITTSVGSNGQSIKVYPTKIVYNGYIAPSETVTFNFFYYTND